MVVLGAIVAGVYSLVPRHSGKNEVEPTDYTASVASARRAAPYPVLAPRHAPTGWKPTSVRYRPDARGGPTWHAGFLTGDGEYAAVEQGTYRASGFAKKKSQGAEPTSRHERIHGQNWTRWVGGGHGYRALVIRGHGATTVVTGTASFSELKKLAGSLRARSTAASGAPNASHPASSGTPDGTKLAHSSDEPRP